MGAVLTTFITCGFVYFFMYMASLVRWGHPYKWPKWVNFMFTSTSVVVLSLFVFYLYLKV